MTSQTFDAPSSAPPVLARRTVFSGWTLATLVIAALVALPVMVVASRVFVPTNGVWDHLVQTVLWEYLGNTVRLVVLVGLGTAVIGVGTAWLVTMCRFPGSRVLEWALLLPMAVPAYVMAYTYTDLLQFVGPIQTGLRALFHWTRRDYWFPDIRTVEGAAAMLTLVLYPYVYLLSRAAFLEQSVCVLEVSRTLGRGPWRSFFTVALPLARPGIVAGLALVMMEVLADFGTVQYFAVNTFTTGIYRTWFAMGEPTAAAQLAAVLMLFVLVLILMERWSRKQAKFHHTTTRYRRLPAQPLTGWKAAAALTACVLPLVLGFVVPGGILLEMALRTGDERLGRTFIDIATNSFTLAAIASAMAVTLAVLLAYGQRLQPTPLLKGAVRVAAMGYAIPGSVIAVGVLIPFTHLDNAIDQFLRATIGVSSGLLLSGTIAAVLFAYMVRFLAVSFNTIEASLGKIRPTMDHAARVLGSTPGRTLVRVHAPIMTGSLLTAALLVFVDVMKELPATMIVRPFNFDTLAVRAYQMASDERLAEAATASLAIVAVGIVPVILLSRSIRKSRPGGA
ncbi:iron(III) transport system permease protein [Azospirillum fermentarium]|uniref:ABC transporter permease n=1 Tax=Azospirillum fermentarium TaxID=1233114 RepID=UPI002227575F|nr:iron ABC transporter permease [Azospirillum fermentarium]MCW2247207.1 iron(III) transport system permease protein [Azospirillum fermentarium]